MSGIRAGTSAVLLITWLWVPAVSAARAAEESHAALYVPARQQLTACETRHRDAPLEHCVEERLVADMLALEAGALASDEAPLEKEIARARAGEAPEWEALELARLRNLARQERNVEVALLIAALERDPAFQKRVSIGGQIEMRILLAMASLDFGKPLAAQAALENAPPITKAPGTILQGLAHRTAGDTHFRQGNLEAANEQYLAALSAFGKSPAGETLRWTVWSRRAVAYAGVDLAAALVEFGRLLDERNAQSRSGSPGSYEKWRLLESERYEAAGTLAFTTLTQRYDYFAYGYRCGPNIPIGGDRPIVPSLRVLARYNSFLGMSAFHAGRLDVAEACFRWAYAPIFARKDIDQSHLVQPLVGLAMLTTTGDKKRTDPIKALEYVRSGHAVGDGRIPGNAPEIAWLRLVDFTISAALRMDVQAYDRAVAFLGSQQAIEESRSVSWFEEGAPMTALASEFALRTAWAAAHKGDAWEWKTSQGEANRPDRADAPPPP